LSSHWFPKIPKLSVLVRNLLISEDPEDESDDVHPEDFLLLDPRKSPLYDTVIEAYAALLYRWKMWRQEAEVLKSLTQPRSPENYVMTVSVVCTSCGRALRGHACALCCRVPCRGRAANDTKLADPVVEETWENAVQGKSANFLRNDPHRFLIKFPLYCSRTGKADDHTIILLVVCNNFLFQDFSIL
jgi:hypothetical protein